MRKIKTLLERYDRVIWIRFVGEFITGISGAMLAPFLILYLHEVFNGSVMIPMLVVSLQPFTEMLVTFLAGQYTDRVGRKISINGSLFLQGAAMIGFIFADSVWLIAVLYALNGAGRAIYIPASRAQIADQTSEDMRSEVFAVISAIGSFGMTIGPAAGLILYKSSPSLLFLLEGSALLIYFAICTAFMKETAPFTTGAHVNGNGFGTAPAIRKPLSFYLPLIGVMLLSMPISLFYAQMETTYRLFSQDMFKDGVFALTLMSIAKAVISLFVEIPLVKWSSKFTMKKIIGISYVCFALAAVGLGLSSTYVMLIITVLILTIGESIGLNHFLSFVGRMAPADKRGTFFAIYGTHWDLSRTISPAIGGIIMLHVGGGFIFFGAGALLLITLVIQQKVAGIAERSYLNTVPKNIPDSRRVVV
ncbi:MDR family MFS transporter [Falsibacillus pallidus]|uniref:Putative MFS family arabinose efflux permease n=1 Tax=Falsibacillus pallidus TaxID=493781 RepID=A0A370GR42_9BACI|nr:MFS transporter [Falsibacillus pallidus]RDI45790.1 putative MFS family arabinose efflux permease [Falsibacillus pallidus]